MIGRAKAFLLPAVLVAGLPLAILAIVLPANEYEATLGIRALDCDGPISVQLVAVPALILYGIGFAANVRHWRRPLRAAIALACLLLCAAITANLAASVRIANEQEAECREKDRV